MNNNAQIEKIKKIAKSKYTKRWINPAKNMFDYALFCYNIAKAKTNVTSETKYYFREKLRDVLCYKYYPFKID